MLPFVPTAVRPFLDVPPVPVRVPTTPDVEIVGGGVQPPFGPPIVTVTEMPPTPPTAPPTSPPVVERPFVQPTPVTPAVPVYPRKQARH